MKALILAAGIGSRLRPITDEVPKCMVKVNNQTIIERQINNLIENNVNEIIVVGGYKSDLLREFIFSKFPTINYIENKEFMTTNNMYSFYLSHSYIYGQDFLLLNGDVFFESGVISSLLKSDCSNIACDITQYNDESMKITIDRSSSIINKISKNISSMDYYAISIDIYKFNSSTSKVLCDEIIDIITRQNNFNQWTEVAIDNILSKVKIYPCIINNKWFEIDTIQDLKIAEKLFKL